MIVHIDERPLQWIYSATALTGLLLLILLPSSSRHVAPHARRSYGLLQVCTLLGALVGAKLVFLAGDLGWPLRSVELMQVVASGRSITGGLLGGFLAAELAKLPLGYRELPNDAFAVKLPISIGIGRVGCLLAGCCRGVPGEYPLALAYADGVTRFPAQLAELAFQVLAFGAGLALFRRGAARGRVFSLYMLTYGAFRFGIEALRETPKVVVGLSVYQLACVALLGAGAASWVVYSRRARDLAG